MSRFIVTNNTETKFLTVRYGEQSTFYSVGYDINVATEFNTEEEAKTALNASHVRFNFKILEVEEEV